MTEDEYQKFIRAQRTEGREAVRQMGYRLRRELFGGYPDPIDKAMIDRFHTLSTKFADSLKMLNLGAIRVGERFGPFDQWRAESRIALSVIDPHRAALVATCSLA